MYCPKCGQQVSETMRFCSRCGLLISEVADWLAGTGGLAVRDEAQESVPSPRRKGMRRGAKIMFWGGILLPVFFAVSIIADSVGPLLIPFIVLLTGLAWLLYSRLFGEEFHSNNIKQGQDVRLGATPVNSALPPASDAGIISSGRREARTAEMAQPPSVTDHTTKLLDRE
jgi:endogenous inhibitor of DNA gyrase (YacG/DUF329 family)